MPTFDQRHQSVFQQLNADTINIILSQIAESRTRQWRPLMWVPYLLYEDTELYQSRFLDDIVIAMNDAFENSGYVKFTTLISVKNHRASDGVDYVTYVLCGHQIAFLDALRTRTIERWKTVDAAVKAVESLQGDARQGAVDEINKKFFAKHSKLSDWKREAVLSLTGTISTMESEYDPVRRMATLRTTSNPSLDPADYPDHLARTSELFTWIAGWYGQPPVGYVGNVNWLNANPRLLRIFAFILDHGKVDFRAIRVDANDYEQWDYSYPSLEEEILARSKGPS
jgi:hypothetical protein